MYGPEHCVFVPQVVNDAFRNKKSSTGYTGVTVNGKKFQAECRINETLEYLGQFDNPAQAHTQWQRAKIRQLQSLQQQFPVLPR